MAQNQAQADRATYCRFVQIDDTPFMLGFAAEGVQVLWGAGHEMRRCPDTFSTEKNATSAAMLALVASVDMGRTPPKHWPPLFQKRPPLAAGYVYFIGGDVGPVKIGFARNVEGRLSSLQTGSPLRLAVLAVAPGTMDDERAYHDRFATHRQHGEWFDRHPDILAEIARLTPTQETSNAG